MRERSSPNGEDRDRGLRERKRVERGRNGAPKTRNNGRDSNLKEDNKTISIHPDDLVAKLREVERCAQGDLARVIELLLVENLVLQRQRSVGLMRGVSMRFDAFPRFLKLGDPPEHEPEDDTSAENCASDQ